jgi:hypothetical protein
MKNQNIEATTKARKCFTTRPARSGTRGTENAEKEPQKSLWRLPGGNHKQACSSLQRSPISVPSQFGRVLLTFVRSFEGRKTERTGPHKHSLSRPLTLTGAHRFDPRKSGVHGLLPKWAWSVAQPDDEPFSSSRGRQRRPRLPACSFQGVTDG